MRRLTSGLERDPDGAPGELLSGRGERLTPFEPWRPIIPAEPAEAERSQPARTAQPAQGGRARRPVLDRVLLAVEVLAAVGLLTTMGLSFGILQRVAQDARTILQRRQRATQTAMVVEWQSPAPVSTAPTSASLPTGSPSPSATARATRVPSPTMRPSATATAVPTRPAPASTPDSPTGVRFAIPAIGVDAPMVEGDGWDMLKNNIGHRVGSAWPGERGNVVISAHNDVHGAIFKDLGKLQPGDEVLAYTPEGVYRYEVVSSQIVLPTDVSVIEPTDEPILTMITCYPPLVDTHRLVVTARLVE